MKKYKLTDIFEIQIGKTPSRSNKYYWGDGSQWLSIKDLNNLEEGKYIAKSKESITNAAISDTNIKIVPPGTLLYSFKLSIGKVAITKNSIYTNEAIAAFLPKKNVNVNIDYLFYLLKSTDVSKLAHDAAKGKSLNKRTLEKIVISLPSYEVQRKKADLLNQVQNSINNRLKTIELLEEYFKSVFLEMFGDPIIDNKGIGKKPLSFFGEWKSGGTPPRSEEKYFKGDIPWFSSGELNHTYIYDSKEHITDEAIEKTSAQKIDKGSLLLGMYDTAALKASITTVDCSCNQAVAFAKLNEKVCVPIFIYYNIIFGRDFFLNRREGAKQKNLNLTKIKETEVLYPKISEQLKFVEKFDLFQNQLSNYRKSLSLLQELFQSLLYQTFNQIDKKEDEIDILLNDEFELERLLEEIKNANEIETTTQYDILKDRLFQVLERTEERNLENMDFKKGIVQVLDKSNVKLEYNKLYKLNNNEVS
ncbi:restriction endonuclease subunit S [Gaetbulibacter jejuensis]|uniref:Type I restriction modification DNA specificity domain-containing protein n=1 Tax=Gaetbulibacter jejuensis TaxID=584607 RepID=A0ABP3V6R6_9FLAO